MSFIMISLAWSASLLSTTSMMHCLKKGSLSWLPISSRASRPFLRATWASSTSFSMMAMGSYFLVFISTAKCLGMAVRVGMGKLAMSTAKVQPMVMNTEAPSTKLPIWLTVRNPSVPPCIIPMTITPKAATTPMI